MEAGGKQAYTEMLAGDLYSPYAWGVRRFREGETNETVVRFRPDGTAYGFRESVPEDEPGATLEPEAAQTLAEAAVDDGWDVDLGEFELVEASHEVRPGGRTDHTLVYERPDVTIGDGRYRLRLTVSGDRFTELTHFVKIPEAFSRRYAEMRSANDAIATGSVFAIAILYMAGGCVVGLFFLLKERWVVWKPALKWALFIAFLQALVVLNQWPLLWMGYDTAISSTTFALQQIAVALAQLVGMGSVLALSFIAAESLGRKAFPRHIQLWKTWSGEVAPTTSTLGQTVAGYLLIGIFFAYEVWLYLFTARHFDWWSPSSALTDPDVLANIFPWLTSVAISLQAGFWEECLFRAVPLAAAALLGKKFGKPWLWITGAMILQAAIFGAGHANYPAQPAYARLVELIIPALGFGGLYLLFGLVPAIVFHFAFDVVWFAMPLFAADTPGIWISRWLVIILTLIPLWVVLRARLRAGAWVAVPADAYNAAWVPPPAPERAAAVPQHAASGLSSRLRIVLPTLGIVGLIVWGLATNFQPDAPVLANTDGEARTAAREQLAATGVVLGDEWRELANAQAPLGLADRFIWTEGGAEAYDQLLGRYLPVPRRVVRYAKFEGNVAERAEEFLVFVGPDGEVQRMTHRLPEGRAGAQLEEDEARAIAVAALRTDLGLEPEGLEEVSADPSQLPERRDWSFVFKDPAGYPLDTGEARIIVRIAGDEVVETGRFVHIPEEWEREHRKEPGRLPDRSDRLRRADGAVVSRRGGAGGGAVEPRPFRPGDLRHLFRRHGGARRHRARQRFPRRDGPVHDRATVENAGRHRPHRRAHRHHRDRGGDQPVDRSRPPLAAAADEVERLAGHRRRSRPRRAGVGARCSGRGPRPFKASVVAVLWRRCRHPAGARRGVGAGVVVGHRHRVDAPRRGRRPGGHRRLAAAARRGLGNPDRSRTRGRRKRQCRVHSPLARRRRHHRARPAGRVGPGASPPTRPGAAGDGSRRVPVRDPQHRGQRLPRRRGRIADRGGAGRCGCRVVVPQAGRRRRSGNRDPGSTCCYRGGLDHGSDR